ncbi:hypothetical protein ZWY2020_015554 [Hordeum vulgare]|nr:hypothetical protein ZWY2020_015554 [Hordeum vulgare]
MAASATTGALNPLLGKLSQLLGDEYKKLTGVRKQASFLKDELSAMKALLDKMELMDKLDHSAKNWRDHIREMSYDMENCIDDFIHDIEGAREKKGFVRKMAQRLRRLGRRHQIASRIEDLKVLAVENASSERYKIDECINSSHGTVVVDPRITAIYKEAAGLVGIDGPREELMIETTVDLTAIGRLFLLRYLKVSASSAAIALPAEIQSLMHLQTLVVYCKMTQSFPSDISSLANLFHLELPMDIGLPEGIKKMKSLCTLRCWDMLKSSLLEDIKGLGELINLKELYLSTHYSKCLTLEQEDALVSSIEMLRELKRLEIDWVHGCSDPDNQLESLHSPPPRLEELYLIKWEFRRVPKWIGELSCLRILDLHVLHLSSDEVRLLGELPSLVYVSLFLSNVSQGKVVVGMGLFPVLEEFWFQPKKDANAYLSFEAGAMPKLETLALILIWTEWRCHTSRHGVPALPPANQGVAQFH